MSAAQLLEGLKAGTITVDALGHTVTEHLLPEIEEHLELAIDILEGVTAKDLPDSVSAQLYDPKHPSYFFGRISIYCEHCGKRLVPYLRDDTTISFIKQERKDDTVDFVQEKPCELAVLTPTKTEINVPSGQLVFQNFFDIKTPDGVKNHQKYSLNHIKGCINTAKYFAKSDVGYGQVGNTSVDIYLRKDGKAIKIVESLCQITEWEAYEDTPPAEDIQEAAADLLVNYDELGNISLDMWRWMCADKTIADTIKHPSSVDIVECDVETGTWEITHYSDTVGNKHDFIVAELELK